jgi:hypothetical protein
LTIQQQIEALETVLAKLKAQVSSDPAKRPTRPQEPTTDLSVKVETWKVGTSKNTGKAWAKLVDTNGDEFLVFDADVINAMDPLFPSDVVMLQTTKFTDKAGKSAVKVVGYSLLSRSERSARDQRDIQRDEIPF